MTVVRSRTFRRGNSEAIRLPRDVAFGEDVELVIARSGDVMTIYPVRESIPEMIARLRALPVSPTVETRDGEIPGFRAMCVDIESPTLTLRQAQGEGISQSLMLSLSKHEDNVVLSERKML